HGIIVPGAYVESASVIYACVQQCKPMNVAVGIHGKVIAPAVILKGDSRSSEPLQLSQAVVLHQVKNITAVYHADSRIGIPINRSRIGGRTRAGFPHNINSFQRVRSKAQNAHTKCAAVAHSFHPPEYAIAIPTYQYAHCVVVGDALPIYIQDAATATPVYDSIAVPV